MAGSRTSLENDPGPVQGTAKAIGPAEDLSR